MSTLATTNIKNPSSSVNNLVLSSDGSVTATSKIIGAGLDHILTQSYSSVSSISINNCFTSKYENYKIMFHTTAISVTSQVSFRLRSNGTDKADALYIFGGMFGNQLGTTGSYVGSNTTLVNMGTQSSTYPWISQFSMEVFSPKISSYPTNFSALSSVRNATESFGFWIAGTFYSLSEVDGFTLWPASGTFSGDVRVYGYKNS